LTRILVHSAEAVNPSLESCRSGRRQADSRFGALCALLGPLSPHSGKALQLRADFQNAVYELIAPSIFSGEVASALTKAERQECARHRSHRRPMAAMRQFNPTGIVA